jgi:phospholipase/carboxylesterase
VDLAHSLWEPAGPGPHPTIVALHGWGASALDLIGLAPALAQGRCQVICPQGPLVVPVGPGEGYGWFPLTGGQPVAAGSIEAAADAATAFLDAAVARYVVDPRKLVLLGFSQGGVLAYRMALTTPDRFAGLAALSSWLPPALVATVTADDGHRMLPTLIQHGSDDGIIAVSRAHQSVESLRALHVPVTYREYPMAHEISPHSLADLSGWLEEKVLSVGG